MLYYYLNIFIINFFIVNIFIIWTHVHVAHCERKAFFCLFLWTEEHEIFLN